MNKHLFLALSLFTFSTITNSVEPKTHYAAAFINAPHLSGKAANQIFFVTLEGNELTTMDLNQVADLLIAEFNKTASVAQQQELTNLRNTFDPLGNNFLLQKITPPTQGIDILIAISFDTSWRTLNVKEFMDTYKKGFSREYANWLEKEFLTPGCLIIVNPESFSCLSI